MCKFRHSFLYSTHSHKKNFHFYILPPIMKFIYFFLMWTMPLWFFYSYTYFDCGGIHGMETFKYGLLKKWYHKGSLNLWRHTIYEIKSCIIYCVYNNNMIYIIITNVRTFTLWKMDFIEYAQEYHTFSFHLHAAFGMLVMLLCSRKISWSELLQYQHIAVIWVRLHTGVCSRFRKYEVLN